MSFQNKIKTRIGFAGGYALLGVAMIVLSFCMPDDEAYLSSFGLALAVMGLARLKQYLPLLFDADRMRKREIVETDERNVMIVNRARSLTLMLFTVLCCLAVIVLSAVGLKAIAMAPAAAVGVLTVIYLIVYRILSARY